MSAPTVQHAETVKRGDTWDGLTVTVNLVGFDFAGATARAQLRGDTEDGLLHTFAPLTLNAGTVGQMQITGIGLSAAESAALPTGTAYGDVEFTHPQLGTRTVFTWSLAIAGDITQ